MPGQVRVDPLRIPCEAVGPEPDRIPCCLHRWAGAGEDPTHQHIFYHLMPLQAQVNHEASFDEKSIYLTSSLDGILTRGPGDEKPPG